MISGSAVCSASVEALWAVWTDPSCWAGGPVEYARANGAFQAGGSYTVKVRGHRPVTATISEVDAPRSWTSRALFPGLRLTLHHILQPEPAGVVVTEGVVFAGALAPVAKAVLARRLRATYAATTAHCAHLAEASAAR
jgi:hypothetical protein